MLVREPIEREALKQHSTGIPPSHPRVPKNATERARERRGTLDANLETRISLRGRHVGYAVYLLALAILLKISPRPAMCDRLGRRGRK